jgi:geranylgeranyl diphosphate synthase type II
VSVRSAAELRELVEDALADLALTPELGRLTEPMRYALDGGGKRVRPVLCLAVAEAAGGRAEEALPAAAALELVHTFSLVHDDLPALDDDDERRGRPSAHVAWGETAALLAGDALLAEAFRLALSYPGPAVARELVGATLGMIGGQWLDVTGQRDDEAALNRLKTGRLFDAAVGCGLWVAGVPEGEQGPWRAFAAEVGALFQLVDDLLDGDGVAASQGAGRARALAEEAAARAQRRLAELDADTSVLAELAAGLAARTS